MPKTALLAAATLLLAVAALVTDVISPYAGDVMTKPAQVQQVPAQSPLRVPAKSGPIEIAEFSSSPKA